MDNSSDQDKQRNMFSNIFRDHPSIKKQKDEVSFFGNSNEKIMEMDSIKEDTRENPSSQNDSGDHIEGKKLY